MKQPQILLFAASALLLAACGDDDERGPYNSGVDDERDVSTLDDDDKAQICRSLDAHLEATVSFDELARLVCLPPAVLLSSSRDACQASLDACVKNAPPPVRIRATAMDQQACYSSLSECRANVGALESCVNVSVDSVLDFLERVTCTKFDDQATREAAQSMQTARGCAELSASCEDFTLLI